MSVYWDSGPDIGRMAEHIRDIGGALDYKATGGRGFPLPHMEALLDIQANDGIPDFNSMDVAGEQLGDVAKHLTALKHPLANDVRNVSDLIQNASGDTYHDSMDQALDTLPDMVSGILTEHTGVHPDDWNDTVEGGVYRP
jgi:hypothetical protein